MANVTKKRKEALEKFLKETGLLIHEVEEEAKEKNRLFKEIEDDHNRLTKELKRLGIGRQKCGIDNEDT